MRFRISIVILAIVAAVGNANAETYYLSPSGNDANIGTSISAPWATLQHAQYILGPGDTLLIMGGTYLNNQYMVNPNDGSEDSPVVLKAYGDSIAYFKRGPGGANDIFFVLHQTDWFTIDGSSYLDANDKTRYLVFQPGGYDGMEPNYAYAFIQCYGNSGSEPGTSDHITIKSIEVSGLYCGHSVSPNDESWLYNGMYLWDGRYWEISDCYWHHIGDSTQTYGAGYGLMYENTRFMKIENNVFTHAGHALIENSDNSCYNIIRNNIITNYWGGGIYLYVNADYNLIEGNLVYHSGTSYNDGVAPDYPKACIQLPSSHNVFRNNVFYTPYNEGFALQARLRVTPSGTGADSNLIYNNTFYWSGQGYGTFLLQVLDSGIYARDNLIANNIIYRAKGWGGGTACMNVADEYACPEVLVHDESGTGNITGNIFKNNLIRKWEETALCDTLVMVNPGCNRYNLQEIEAIDPAHWYDNIPDRPMFISEDPETYGLISNWWHLRENSPCIDKGTFIDDWIGAYVESRYPGYGWGNIGYSGARPDIGAYEYDTETTFPMPPPTRIQHTSK